MPPTVSLQIPGFRRPAGCVGRLVAPGQRAIVGVLAGLCLVLAGCDKVTTERAETAAWKQEQAAIQQYSAASEAANGAHRAVVEAFEVANRSSNLPEYQRALQSQVLPKMDAFVARLEAMPVGTDRLRAIHGRLVQDYRTARRDIEAFAKTLDSAEKLGQFARIRDALQAGVRTYRQDLQAFYRDHDRQLRLDPGPVAPASAATPTAAAASPTTVP